MNSHRINSIVYTRIIAMLMVVLFHSALYYTSTWSSYEGAPNIRFISIICGLLNNIDMPAFVFIAGYLSSKKLRFTLFDSIIFLKSKVFRLLIPYFIWGIIEVSCFNYPLNELFTGVAHLWFLLMLFICFVLAEISNKLTNNYSTIKPLIFVISLCIFWLYYYLGFNDHIKVIYYFPIFIFGSIYGFFSSRQKVSVFSILVLLSALMFLVNKMILNIAVFNFYCVQLVFMLIPPILIECFVFWGSEKKQVKNYVLKLDKYSMGIYIFHHFVIQLVLSFSFIRDFLNTNWLFGVLFLFSVSSISAYLLTSFFRENKYLSYLIG